ncbi:MAG: hypothetical protein DHS80DRAFT_26239 [Piptocephalis tieghemiana]|nr:MAG: hypothetical protein DHS80DRAFT_26239 [Piptocephalis tieghemiana]
MGEKGGSGEGVERAGVSSGVTVEVEEDEKGGVEVRKKEGGEKEDEDENDEEEEQVGRAENEGVIEEAETGDSTAVEGMGMDFEETMLGLEREAEEEEDEDEEKEEEEEEEGGSR